MKMGKNWNVGLNDFHVLFVGQDIEKSLDGYKFVTDK